ncbi:MAG: HEPN domain-containing protein [Nanoarchaeota archaeon]|nr:HEPN domain-containing protein [Nanoarchaeota archaeon]
MEDKLEWCFKRERGISLIEPNENLMRAYLKKAQNALKVTTNVPDLEWKVVAAYYSIYYSVYALLMKIGIKSEIHSCTVELCRRVLKNHLSEDDIELFEEAKRIRRDAQYYSIKNEDIGPAKDMIRKAPDFCIKAREIAKRIDITHLRASVYDMIQSSDG